MTHNIFNIPVLHSTDSDESDDEEMSPMGSFWPAPEDEEWKMVERSHGSLRGTTEMDSDRLHKSGDQLDHSGMRCGQLDFIEETDNCGIRPEVLLCKWKEATQYEETEPATMSVRPAVCKRPNVIVVVPSKSTDRRDNCPVNVVLTPQVKVQESFCVGTQAGELFPEEPEVAPAEMAEEASTGDIADNQPLSVNQLHSMTTVMFSPTDYDVIEKPAPRRGLVEVAEETSTDDTTIEKYMYEVLEVAPAEMAEEASTGDMADNQPLSVNQLYTMTTVMFPATDYDEIERPAPRRWLVEVAEEASSDDTTIEKCMYDVLDNNETTARNCPRNCLKYLSSRSREGFWKWPRRPGILVWKRSSLFLWKKFYHSLPK